MNDFYMSRLFRSVPTYINDNFKLTDYISSDSIEKLYKKLRQRSADRYVKWAITEYASALWLHTVCGFPDVIPNENDYFTDLDYKNQKYCNFHIKFVDMDDKTVHGTVNKTNKREGLLYDKSVIANDVVLFGKFDFATTDVKIVGTVPVKMITWEDPFMVKLKDIKAVVNYSTVLKNNDVYHFSSHSIKTSEMVSSNPKLSLFDVMEK